MAMSRILALLVVIGLLGTGCTALKTFPQSARGGDTIALAVGSMWEETLSVDVSFEKREWKHFLEARDQRDAWQVMRFSWFGDYNDPMTFAAIFQSGHEQNLPGWSDARYDELIRTARAETDMVKRNGLMQEAERILMDAYAIAPLYFYVSKHFVSPRVTGFKENVLDRHPTRHLGLIEMD